VSNPDAYPLLAREGRVHMVVALVTAFVVTASVGWWWASPLWLVVVFVVQFFRDPPRQVPEEPGLAVCPADGKVVFVGRQRDPYLDREALKISIFMNVFSVHSNRTPVAGTVRQLWYTSGRFLNAELDKASYENERNAMWIKGWDGNDVTCVQIAGLVARRILCYVKAGDEVTRGQRYGFIRFGSRVDLYLPADFRVSVKLGEKVKAGSNPLGCFDRS
jgi:phosphatidylserine decarboxylase